MTSELSDSLWHKSCRETANAAALTQSAKADLAIIGGGYTGLSAALHAAQDGAKVRLIEAREIGWGGSGRNVGLVNAGMWLPPNDIIDRLGEVTGLQLTRLLAAAPDLVYQLITDHDIQCEPVRKGTLHCAHAPAGMTDLTNRYDQQKALGAPVQLLSREETIARVGSDRVYGALFDPRAGTIQPLAYAKGLARAAVDAGAHIHENSPAISVTKTPDGWCVVTPKGKITAHNLIVATNAYSLPIEGMITPRVIPVHYFQAATEPLSHAQRHSILPNQEGCWDTALVMSSWRLDQAGRLIIGAMGDLGHPASGIHRSWLLRKFNRMFPQLSGLQLGQAWYGRIAMTAEYLPKIQSLGDTALVAFGYSGRGIGPGTVFGERMARSLLSGNPDCLPVPPVIHHHLPYAGLRQAYYETGASLTHLVKDRF